MNKSEKPTIRDVARSAGVSIATVSRYINSSGYVDGETALKIKKAIGLLEYRPDRIAQGLKSRRSRQIMLVVPDICNPFYSAMYKAVQAFVHEKDYSVILYNTNEKQEEEIAAVEMSGDINADGLLFCSINTCEPVVERLGRAKSPVVLLNSYEDTSFDTVHSLKGGGLYIAARHLMELGHRDIAYAGGPAESVINRRRKQGFVKALAEQGVGMQEDLCFEMGFSMDAGYKAGKYFTSLKRKATAVCAANDLIAMGIMLAFNEGGVRIPEDMSLTGMDNIEFAALSRPGLTTVTNNPVEFGENASRLLFDRLEGRYSGDPREINIQPGLILRNSTKGI